MATTPPSSSTSSSAPNSSSSSSSSSTSCSLPVPRSPPRSSNNGTSSTSASSSPVSPYHHHHHHHHHRGQPRPPLTPIMSSSSPSTSSSSSAAHHHHHHHHRHNHHRARLTQRILSTSKSVLSATIALASIPLAFYSNDIDGPPPVPYETRIGKFQMIVIGWEALLHMSIWPIVVIVAAVGFILAHKCSYSSVRGGRCTNSCGGVYGRGSESCYNNNHRGVAVVVVGSSGLSSKSSSSSLTTSRFSSVPTNVGGGGLLVGGSPPKKKKCKCKCKSSCGLSRSTVVLGWYILCLSVLLSISTTIQSQMQIISPSWLWNPFMWGWYRVYKPTDIQDALQGLCLDSILDNQSGGGGGGGGEGHDDGGLEFTPVGVVSMKDESSSSSSSSPGVGIRNGASSRSSFLSSRSNNSKNSIDEQPLCLPESSWKSLSAESLSSRNQHDVETVYAGIRYAQKQSSGLIINVMSRDTIDSIEALRYNVEGLVPFFDKLSVVVFENDSTDGTRDAFKRWSTEVSSGSGSGSGGGTGGGGTGGGYDVDLMSCGETNPDCIYHISHRYDSTESGKEYFRSSAIGKMAEFRQTIVDYIMENTKYNDYSHMMVIDLDLGVSFSPLGVMHTIGMKPNDAVASSGRQPWPGSFGTLLPPYDFSAFRAIETGRNRRIRQWHTYMCELSPPGDRWRNQCDAVSPMHMMLILGHDRVSGSGKDREPYPVQSAFNGATLYPLHLIRETGAKYDVGDDGQRCEHIGFNIGLGKPMYINPKWNMHINPVVPGGPTGGRAIKNVFRIVFTPKLSVPIFVQNMICMMIFVYGILTLVMTVLYPIWVKVLTGTRFRQVAIPCGGAMVDGSDQQQQQHHDGGVASSSSFSSPPSGKRKGSGTVGSQVINRIVGSVGGGGGGGGGGISPAGCDFDLFLPLSGVTSNDMSPRKRKISDFEIAPDVL